MNLKEYRNSVDDWWRKRIQHLIRDPRRNCKLMMNYMENSGFRFWRNCQALDRTMELCFPPALRKWSSKHASHVRKKSGFGPFTETSSVWAQMWNYPCRHVGMTRLRIWRGIIVEPMKIVGPFVGFSFFVFFFFSKNSFNNGIS